jgi:hypothetical protein
VFRPGDDVTVPRLIRAGRPNYPPEALGAKIQGRVELEAKGLPVYAWNERRVAVPVLVSMEVSFAIPK